LPQRRRTGGELVARAVPAEPFNTTNVEAPRISIVYSLYIELKIVGT
jgi:hypothetical protein